VRVLKRRELKAELPTPKRHRRLPTVLSPGEVGQLIAGAKNLYHRTMPMTLYGAGLRRTELLHLKVADLDSQPMVIHVERGKGGRGREVPLSPTLLTALREYYRWMRPKTYLFPGQEHGWRADKPLTSKCIWDPVRLAATTAGIDCRVSPHTRILNGEVLYLRLRPFTTVFGFCQRDVTRNVTCLGESSIARGCCSAIREQLVH
jgi:integrase/recombinase XerD